MSLSGGDVPDIFCVFLDGAVGGEDAGAGDVGQGHLVPALAVAIDLKGPLVGREGWIRKINRRKRTAYLEIDMFGRTIQTKIGLGIVRKRT